MDAQLIYEARQAIESLRHKCDPNLKYSLDNLADLLFNQYLDGGDIENIHEAIQVGDEVIRIIPQNDPDRSEYLDSLANSLIERYINLGEVADLNRAISLGQEAVTICSPEHPRRLAYLNNHAARLADQYRRTGATTDLDEMIRISQEVLDATDVDNPKRAIYLCNAALRLQEKYHSDHSVNCLEQAISFQRAALQLTRPNDYGYTDSLEGLASLLRDRYMLNKDVKDLEASIESGRQVVAMTENGSINHISSLNELSCTLSELYKAKENIAVLEESIKIARDTIEMSPPGYPDRWLLLRNLADRVAQRYSVLGSVADFDESIELRRSMVTLIPQSHEARGDHAYILARSLDERYETKRDLNDLKESVRFGRLTTATIFEDQINPTTFVHDQMLRLERLHKEDYELPILEEAIDLGRRALALSSLDDSERADISVILAMLLAESSSALLTVSNLDEAVSLVSTALASIPPQAHTQKNVALSTLARVLRVRFSLFRALEDLTEAIRLQRAALASAQRNGSEIVQLSIQLTESLSAQYDRTKEITVLDEAIQLSRASISSVALDDRRLSEIANLLSGLLIDSFQEKGDISLVDEAIQLGRKAVEASQFKGSDRPEALCQLGVALEKRFLRLNTNSDLDEAISCTREAVRLARPGFGSDRARGILASMLGQKYRLSGQLDDIIEARSLLEASMQNAHKSSMVRLSDGIRLFRACAILADWEKSYEVLTTISLLVPSLTLKQFSHYDKQYYSQELSGLASEAAAITLNVSRPPYMALSLLESMRGLLSMSVEELRADLGELRMAHPNLAERLEKIRPLLDATITDEVLNTDSVGHSEAFLPYWKSQHHRRYEASREFDEIIAEIRRKKGFETFLLPPTTEDMCNAARSGPIVVVYCSRYRSDAIIVLPSEIRVVSLPFLSPDGVEDHIFRPNTARTLQWLWDTIARPVLESLGLLETRREGEDWPRLWWVPIGPLTKFPIHAAGYHNQSSSEAVMDHVISSYSSSLRALKHSYESQAEKTALTSNEALLVSMAQTPRLSFLPFAAEEITMIRKACSAMSLGLIESKRSTDDVLASLSRCKVFHFAGHGSTPDNDPSHGALLLDDWQSNPLTVAKILAIDLQSHTPFLAYLSACGTGKIRNEKFLDEHLHLIHGFQLAGFRHVIGTLWEVQDETCVEMARIFYQVLADRGLKDEAVSFALHQATRELRGRWLKGQQSEVRDLAASNDGPLVADNGTSAERDRDIIACIGEDSPLSWIPYVHFAQRDSLRETHLVLRLLRGAALNSIASQLFLFQDRNHEGGDGVKSFLRHTWQPLILLDTVPAVAFADLVLGILTGLRNTISAGRLGNRHWPLCRKAARQLRGFNSVHLPILELTLLIISVYRPDACHLSLIAYLVRKRIYFFAHLIRECPVVIVPASQLVNRPDHSTFPANVPGWGWRCQFQLRKNLDGGPIPKETRECRCPEFPKQLLLLNKALHTEVQAILYGENKFVLRAHQAEGLRVFEMLSSDAIDKLRYLLVRLNSWPCYRGHSRANLDRGVCLGCRAPVSSSDREISAGDIHTGSILTQWSAVCSRLASSTIPGCLRLEFICDVTDEVTAKQILQPLYMLPQLQECTIRLGRHRDQSLRSLARLAATRLTNSDPADSPGENASSCFRFGFLPPEIRHKILRYTDLGPDGSYRPQWKDIVVKRGRFDQTLGLTTSLIRRDCCLNCSFTKLDCSCPLQYASYSPHCQCRNLPLDLFLVSQQTYQDASEILYSTNVFIFTGPFLDTLGMLQSLKPSSLIHFRRITFDLQTTQSLQWRELESTWLPLLSFIGRHCDISQLLITIKCGDDYEECIEPTYNEPMMRNLYNGYKTLVQGLKSTLPGLLDFHLTLGAFLQLEPTWEKYIMGPNYDSREGNRYSKAAHSVDIWPHLSPDVTSAPHWHEEF